MLKLRWPFAMAFGSCCCTRRTVPAAGINLPRSSPCHGCQQPATRQLTKRSCSEPKFPGRILMPWALGLQSDTHGMPRHDCSMMLLQGVCSPRFQSACNLEFCIQQPWV